MKIITRKKGGDIYNSRNLLDTRILWEEMEGKSVYICTYSIEVITGNVTHGGGAEAGVFLNYRGQETDLDSDGKIDYTDTMIHTTMEEPGYADIKVSVKVVFEEEILAYQAAWSLWSDARTVELKILSERNGPDTERTEFEISDWDADNARPEIPLPTLLTGGLLNLEWLEHTYSDWV